jgi:hypothetical protein
MEQNEREQQNGQFKVAPTETSQTPHQVALENLRRLSEAVERFGKQVESGTIAPPTSAGRWE